jgi:ABC-type multidrug transport system permease subunit
MRRLPILHEVFLQTLIHEYSKHIYLKALSFSSLQSEHTVRSQNLQKKTDPELRFLSGILLFFVFFTFLLFLCLYFFRSFYFTVGSFVSILFHSLSRRVPSFSLDVYACARAPSLTHAKENHIYKYISLYNYSCQSLL